MSEITEKYTFYSNRLMVWGETEMPAMKMFSKVEQSIQYSVIALVVGVAIGPLTGFLGRFSNIAEKLWPIYAFGPDVAWIVAGGFMMKAMYHGIFDNVEVSQKSLRVDFSDSLPLWQSNDDTLWEPVKIYVESMDATRPRPNIAERI